MGYLEQKKITQNGLDCFIYSQPLVKFGINGGKVLPLYVLPNPKLNEKVFTTLCGVRACHFGCMGAGAYGVGESNQCR
jgi:hypothetical protein